MTKPVSKSLNVFRKAGQPPYAKLDRGLTRERIENDLSAFEKAGGKIEKLGNTQKLKHIP
jgi:hypothetical protein